MEKSRTERLMEELAALQVGQPEEYLAQMLKEFEERNQYEWFRGNEVGHIVVVDPWYFRKAISRLNWLDEFVRRCIGEYGFASGLRRGMGLRLWMFVGTIAIAKGKVQRIEGSLLVEGENEWLGAEWTYKEKFEEPDRRAPIKGAIYPPELQRYRSGWAHLHMGAETGEILWNEMNTTATVEELRSGKFINSDCLTSWRGCHSLCELMPPAMKYRHAHNYGALGWNSGSWGIQDHACE